MTRHLQVPGLRGMVRGMTGWAAPRAAALGLAAAATLSGCSTVSDRVTLLPQADGSPSAVEVVAGTQRLRLDKPYASAELQGSSLNAVQSSADAVKQRYGSLLDQQPAAPRSFVLPFEANGNRLGPGADAVLADLRAALANMPAAEVIVTGHTDRVGSVEANDKLSLARAERVRELLVAAGVQRAVISVVGRGERAPLVATEDEVAEARNRRVEIKIR